MKSPLGSRIFTIKSSAIIHHPLAFLSGDRRNIIIDYYLRRRKTYTALK
ncbi:MAG: hypothetical protein Q4E41_03195 [Bacteroidales bacterium]|nr:hypothetical protein [Bacteroidales bacterium]